MLVELGPGVNVGRLDGVEEQFGHAHSLYVDEMRLEEDLWCFETLSTKLHHTAVW